MSTNWEQGVYKFINCDTNEIIYIGKSNSSMQKRITAHLKGKGIDEKFNAYKDKCKIFIAPLSNRVEVDLVERALINQYKPILNVVDNYKGFSELISIKEPSWYDYYDILPKLKPPVHKQTTDTQLALNRQKKYAFTSKLFLLGQIKNTDYYINYTTTDNIKISPDPITFIINIIQSVKLYGILNENGDYYTISDEYKTQISRLYCPDTSTYIFKQSFEKLEYISIIIEIQYHKNEWVEFKIHKYAIDELTTVINELGIMT